MSKYRKCNLKDNCSTLADRAYVDAPSGITQWLIMNVETGKYKPTLVGYRKDRKDKGLVFNYCPWCGYDMSKRIAAVEGRSR